MSYRAIFFWYLFYSRFRNRLRNLKSPKKIEIKIKKVKMYSVRQRSVRQQSSEKYYFKIFKFKRLILKERWFNICL